MSDRLEQLYNKSLVENDIPNEWYTRYGVKKGLRNEDGTGVLIGLTRVADVVGYEKVDNRKINCEGRLYYRGYEISDLVSKLYGKRGAFETVCFLILFGHLPNEEEDKYFKDLIRQSYYLPEGFMVTNILRQPSINVMNKIQRALLMLYSEDGNADDNTGLNFLQQGISIIAKMPGIIVYAYQAKCHIIENQSMFIHPVRQKLSIAENILAMLRADASFTEEEANILDLMLILHADHGSGNNSTFTNLVVSSTGTDIYSCLSAGVGALKGPRHGGANITCRQMMKWVISEIGLEASNADMTKIIGTMLSGEGYDNSKLIYGFGHAVYTLSDPRCELLKKQAYNLAYQKGRAKEFEFYLRFETCVKSYFRENKHRDICANVDFYSGLIYEMLGIPDDLFTPMFVTARLVGWLAHILEEKAYCDKIIRPAGKYVGNKID